MAHTEPTGKKKGLGEDVLQQAIHEVISKVAAFLARMTPGGLKESDLWRLAQPVLSVLIAQLTPDGGGWEHVDMIRAELFSEYGEALTQMKSEAGEHIRTGGGESSERSASGGRFVQGILALPPEQAQQTMEWLAELHAGNPELAAKAIKYLNHLPEREIAAFAALDHGDKTAYVEPLFGRTDENQFERLYQSRLWRPVRYATVFFRRTLPHQLREGFGWMRTQAQGAFAWTKGELVAWWKNTVRLAMVLGIVFAALLATGAVIANLGAPQVGRFFMLGSGYGALVVFIILAIRSAGMLAVVAGGTIAADAAAGTALTRELKRVLRIATGAIAWLALLSVMSAVLRLWQNLGEYFAVLLIGAFLFISGFAWERSAKVAQWIATTLMVFAMIALVALSFPLARAWVDEKNAAADTEALRRTAETDRTSDLATARAEAKKELNAVKLTDYRDALKKRGLFLTKGLDKLTPEETKDYSENEARISGIETAMYGRPSTSAPKAPPTGAVPVTSVPRLKPTKTSAVSKTTPSSAAEEDDEDARELHEMFEALRMKYPELAEP